MMIYLWKCYSNGNDIWMVNYPDFMEMIYLDDKTTCSCGTTWYYIKTVTWFMNDIYLMGILPSSGVQTMNIRKTKMHRGYVWQMWAGFASSGTGNPGPKMVLVQTHDRALIFVSKTCLLVVDSLITCYNPGFCNLTNIGEAPMNERNSNQKNG